MWLKQLIPLVLIPLAIILFFPTVSLFNDTFLHSGLVMSDLYSFNYPAKNILKTSLKTHSFPFWTDLVGNGYPLFAEGQLGMLYPPHLLLYSLPFSTGTAMKINILGHIAIAGFATYFFLYKKLKLNIHTALFGSIVFMFSGFIISYIEHVNVLETAVYFPINLILVEYILNQSTITRKIFLRSIFFCTVVVTLQLLTGHIETVYYNLLFAGCFGILKLIMNHTAREKIIAKIGVTIIAVIISTLIVSPQYLSTLELIKFTQRDNGLNTEQATLVSWPVQTLLLFILPRSYPYYNDSIWYQFPDGTLTSIQDIYPYLGILPLIFAIYALFTIFAKRKQLSEQTSYVIIFTLLIAITYIYAVGASTQLFTIVRNVIPGLNFFRFPFKSIYVIQFSIVVLASIGFNAILKQKKLAENTMGRAVLAMIIIFIAYTNVWLYNRPLLKTVNETYWLKESKVATYLRSDSTGDGGRIYSRSLDVANAQNITDPEIQKNLQNLLPANFNTLYQIPSNSVYSGLYLKDYSELNDESLNLSDDNKTITIPSKLKRKLMLQSVKYIVSPFTLNDPSFRLGFTYRFTKKIPHKIRRSNQSNQKAWADSAYVYKNLDYLPRFRMYPSTATEVVNSDSEALKTVIKEDFDLHNAVVIKSKKRQARKMREYRYTGKFFVHKDKPTELTFTVDSPEDSYFIIEDMYYPGWHALLDGKETEILKANYAFKAIATPKGKHTLTVYFEPTWWRMGIVLALIGIGSMIIAGLASFLQEKKENQIQETKAE